MAVKRERAILQTISRISLIVFFSCTLSFMLAQEGALSNVLSNYDDTQKVSNISQKESKAEFLFYPKFRFKNSRLDKIYLLQFNLNPTMHLKSWKGGEITAQLILPLFNEYSADESKIRPGFLTISQSLTLPAQIHLLATAGNFNMNRVGGDLKLFKEVIKSGGIYAQVGYTYWSLPHFDQWFISEEGKLNWRIGANYFIEKRSLLLNTSFAKNLEDDYSLRGELIRYFKNASVGFYLQTLNYDGYAINGGFFFTINLPPRGLGYRSKRVYVAPSKHFDLEYVARPYPARGLYYRTSPRENSNFNFFNNQLLTTH